MGGVHDAEIAGIDALEIPIEPHPSTAKRLWQATWPPVAAVLGFGLLWQVVVWLKVKPEYALPSPVTVLDKLFHDIGNAQLLHAMQITMTRAGVGYAAAFVIGSLIGLAVVGSRSTRAAVGSLVTGLQTMPSIAWFPLAILLFGLTENAILFVVILGAAPAIANGLIIAVDQIPPILVSAGRVLGAKRIGKYRHVILPASFPSFVGGMKQGWAFAWRSLMAGELLVNVGNRFSIGVLMDANRQVSDAVGLIEDMIVILVIGLVVDRLLFGRMEKIVRERWGLNAEV
jgi:NitT/TauT family transport system permease protein